MYTTHDYLSNRIVIHIRNPNDVKFFESLFPKDCGSASVGCIVRYDKFYGWSKHIDASETHVDWYAEQYQRYDVPKGYLKRITLRMLVSKGGD